MRRKTGRQTNPAALGHRLADILRAQGLPHFTRHAFAIDRLIVFGQHQADEISQNKRLKFLQPGLCTLRHGMIMKIVQRRPHRRHAVCACGAGVTLRKIMAKIGIRPVRRCGFCQIVQPLQRHFPARRIGSIGDIKHKI